MKSPKAAVEATVRTWFQAVQTFTYRDQTGAAYPRSSIRGMPCWQPLMGKHRAQIRYGYVRYWLCVDGPVLARDKLASMQVARVQLCVRPVCAVRWPLAL